MVIFYTYDSFPLLKPTAIRQPSSSRLPAIQTSTCGADGRAMNFQKPRRDWWYIVIYGDLWWFMVISGDL